MLPLPEVEEAKTVMTAALEWSVVRWLKEKKRVRKLADKANDALDRSIEKTRLGWSQDLRDAYGNTNGNGLNEELRAYLADLKRAHALATRARAEAESTFDLAEKELSTRLAREGCRQAIRSWDLHEKVIRKAETAGARPAAS